MKADGVRAHAHKTHVDAEIKMKCRNFIEIEAHVGMTVGCTIITYHDSTAAVWP